MLGLTVALLLAAESAFPPLLPLSNFEMTKKEYARRARPSRVGSTTACNQIVDTDLHEVAATQFAVDRQVEQRPVFKPFFPIKHEPDRPDLLRLKRPLGAKLASRIPRGAIVYWVIL